MSKRVVTIAASLVATLLGGWLMLAPFALGYRQAGVPWNHPTEVDFWTGVGVVVLGLAGIAGSLAGVRGELRARGALPAKPDRAERRALRAQAKVHRRQPAHRDQQGPQDPQAQPGLLADHPGRTPSEIANPRANQPAPDLRELLAPLVMALLGDLGQPATAREPASGEAAPAPVSSENHRSASDMHPDPRSHS